MESLLQASSSLTLLSPRIDGRDSLFVSSRVCFCPGLCGRGWKSLPLIVAAKKKNKKEDTHSFVPKPDEATGPFPEAVLLKEKKVQEDGRLLPEFADAEEKELYEFLDLQLQSDLNEERRRHYEVVYLIHEKHAEEVETVNEKIQEFLREKKGTVWRFSDWGMRRLAYQIQKANYAHYNLMNFEIEARYIDEFKTLLDRDERVIRHLVIKRDEAITEDCPPPPEFHTLRASMADNDEFDDDYDDDEEYEEDDEEFEGDELEDDDEVTALYEDEEVGHEEGNLGSGGLSNAGRENRRMVNAGR